MQDKNRNPAKMGGFCPVLRGYGGKNEKEEPA